LVTIQINAALYWVLSCSNAYYVVQGGVALCVIIYVKATEQRLYKVLFNNFAVAIAWDIILYKCVTIQMKAAEQFFYVVLFVMLFNVVLDFQSWDWWIPTKTIARSRGIWCLRILVISLIVPLKIVEAVTLIEDSMDKLQQYGEELAETCHKHFPDLKRRVPKFTRRESSSVEKLKNSSQKQVRVFLVLFFHTNPSNTVKYCFVYVYWCVNIEVVIRVCTLRGPVFWLMWQSRKKWQRVYVVLTIWHNTITKVFLFLFAVWSSPVCVIIPVLCLSSSGQTYQEVIY